MKICKICNVEKRLTEFSLSRNSYRTICKECRAKLDKEMRLAKKKLN